jgi:hypothetical protein
MERLTDERRRALRLLGRHPDGCTEALMMAHGFTIDARAARYTRAPLETQVSALTHRYRILGRIGRKPDAERRDKGDAARGFGHRAR